MIGQRKRRRSRVPLRRKALPLLVGCAAAACPAVAQASTITVQNANDSGTGSLRGAIASSASGDTIDFAPSLNGHTITLTSGELAVSHSLTISGPGASNLTISGNQASRVFDISSGPVAISGLTITGGSVTGQGANVGGGGIYDNAGSLTLNGVAVTGNQASITSGNQSGGGGIFVGFGASALTVTNTTISNNTVSLASSGERVGGGGIFSEGSATTVIAGSTVSGNTETQTNTGSLSSNDGGGGIYEYGTGSPNPVGLTLTNTTVQSNSVTIDTSTGSNGGGGVYSEGGGPLAVAGSTIAGNTFKISSDAGGGDGGAGVYNDGGPMTLDTSTVGGNSATVTSNGGGSGGIGIYNGGGNLSVTGSTIALNSGTVTGTGSFNGGGAVYDNGNQTAYLNSTLYDNSLTLSGGSTSNGGGAIFAYQGSSTSTMTLNDTTIDANGINAPAGAVFEQLGSVTLRNTILADNNASSGGNCGTGTGSGAATITSDGFNIDSANTCGLNQGTDHPSTEPRLGPIQDNGGPTLTQALPSNSPALDAGSCTDAAGNPVSTDQRGIARPQPSGGSCDIGAYELLHSVTVTNANDSGPGSLRDALKLSGSGGSIDFSPALNGQTITLTSGALVIPHALTISGPGAGSLAINGGGNDTVFDIEAGNSLLDTVTISGLTITGGAFSGSGNSGGGGIFANSVSTLTLNGLTVMGNQATVSSASSSGGGGVYVNGGTLIVTNSTISSNTLTITNASGGSNGGGGIYSNGGTITVTGSVVSSNSVVQSATGSSNSDGGGGIYSDGGALTVTNTSVDNNSDSVDSAQDSDGGGGIYSAGGRIAMSGDTVNGNTFTLAASNSGDNGGGGVYSEGGTVTMSGGAVNANTFTLQRTTGGNNGGGGVYSEGGAVTIGSASVGSNTARISNDSSTNGRNGGGGLYSEGGAIAVVSSTIADNSGDVTATGGGNGGGGVLDLGNDSTYLNSTLSDNSITVNSAGADNGGGAIHSSGSSGAIVSLIDATVAGNSADQPGGAILDEVGTYKFKNTILAGNSASPAGDCAAGATGPATFTSAGNNLESANSCGLTQNTDLTNTDPKLAALQDNGGPTLTRALAASSPAVDAGSCTDMNGQPIATDQRGTARPQPAGGKCDIGAYELVQASSPNPGPGPSPTPGPNPHSGPSPQPPATQPATPLIESSTGATLSGAVNPENQPTTIFFQYGLDPRERPPGSSTALYDQSTPPQSLPADSADHPVSATLTGLVPHALYHVRLAATNSAGTTFGPDQTFTTPADPSPPPPVLGKTADAKPVSGRVFIKLPATAARDTAPRARTTDHQAISKGTGFVPLTEARQLPSGTQIDARLGSLQLTAAAPIKRGKLQAGIFGGGVFGFAQDSRGTTKGLTTLSLLEGAFAGSPTYASCRSAHAGDRPTPDARPAVSTKVLQTLHGSAHGKFRTRGRYAAATVRGTVWAMSDRCDGTLTTVTRDTVTVQDFVRHITVLVHAGHSYLARAHR